MRQVTRLWTIIAIGAIAYAGVPATQAAALGSIRGFIKDGQGNPLAGAAVFVLADSEEAKPDKIIKRANTDNEGKFIASGIAPGRYLVKAQAEGFKPVQLPADVKPNKVTVFDSILLRQVGTLADETSLNADPRFAARRARGTIFHYDEPAKDKASATEDTTVALTDRTPEMHGVINAFSQTSMGPAGETKAFAGANFAVSEQIAKDANLVVSGQLGYGEGAPQRLEAMTTAHAGDRHRLSVALAYGRFTFSRRSSIPKIGQFTLSASDTYQVSGPVLVVYGLEFSRFAEGASDTSLLPRFGIAIDAAARTRVFAGLVPGSSGDAQSRVSLESGEIVFSEPKPVAVSSSGDPVLERSYRMQFGGEQVLSENSSIEMMAFFDTVSGRGVGLLAIPVEGAAADPIMHNAEQSGRTRGLRVVYRHRLNKVVEGTLGYAFGEGQRLDPRGVSEPSHLFSNSLFHVFSAKIDANFVSTGTRVSTVLRVAPEQAIFAIDPFQGQISTYDPNLNVSLTQDLPSFGFIPGQWQALIDLRNLLDQQSSVADDRQELVASRFNRLVRVGVSLRF